jgi:DNA-binding response OmpR family regulator
MATILVIEDDEGVQALLYELLTDEGYTVLLADSGEEGLVIVTYDVVDLAIIDLHLPGLPGYAV